MAPPEGRHSQQVVTAAVTRLPVGGDSPKLLSAALEYAERGWPVLPLRPGEKTPLSAHGLKDATSNPMALRSWWGSAPRANIGLATGASFDVLDIDSPDALAALSEVMPPDGPTVDGPTVKTPRGWHCYLAPTGQGNTVRLGGLNGVDWRGRGGYVVVPPSVRTEGAGWSWLLPDDPDFGPLGALRPAPGWLAKLWERPRRAPAASPPPELRQERAYGEAALQAEQARVASALPGSRNHTLNEAAFSIGQLVGGGILDLDRAWHALAGAAAQAGLPADEADATLASGVRAGMAQPRATR